MLPPAAPPPRHSVQHHNKLLPIYAQTDRYKNSAIPTIVKILNS
ncbi:hypothetical protein E2C01_022645 [Portunus trituberculatus]|uniref:Uncharacterized protein n=1 Tax=Portunus trituberculatus TaxID=210409 RepID=A0A5B7E7V5_PORTR|nr:hypothetical protein [Portunus trituberculatus]